MTKSIDQSIREARMIPNAYAEDTKATATIMSPALAAKIKRTRRELNELAGLQRRIAELASQSPTSTNAHFIKDYIGSARGAVYEVQTSLEDIDDFLKSAMAAIKSSE